MEWHHKWERDYKEHEKEHEEGVTELSECLSCEICHPIRNNVPVVFKKFWNMLAKFEDTIASCNNITIKGVLDLLSMENTEREETIHEGKYRNIADRIIESIQYSRKPKLREIGMRNIILVIIRDCIEGNLENEEFDRLIGNPELIKYGYIIEDSDIERRFEKFWQWYGTILGEVKPLKRGIITFKIFKDLLFMEERIAEQSKRVKELIASIEYMNKEAEITEEKYEEVVQKVIERFIQTREFTKEPEEVDSEDSIESYTINEYEDEHFERTLRNYWLENGYEIDISEINRIINFRIEYEIMKTKEFMENYMSIMELDDEEIIEELRKWYNENVTECPICNKMLLAKETIEYNKDFIERICKSCSEEEEKENISEIELRMKQIKELCERAEIEITDGEILNREFIITFQENKNELEKELKRKLNELLKKQQGIIDDEGSGERSDDEKTDESEKIGEILSPDKNEEMDENNDNEIWEENEN